MALSVFIPEHACVLGGQELCPIHLCISPQGPETHSTLVGISYVFVDLPLAEKRQIWKGTTNKNCGKGSKSSEASTKSLYYYTLIGGKNNGFS